MTPTELKALFITGEAHGSSGRECVLDNVRFADGEWGAGSAIAFRFSFSGSFDGNVIFRVLCTDDVMLDELTVEQWAEYSFDVEVHAGSDAWDIDDTLAAIAIAGAAFKPIVKKYFPR